MICIKKGVILDEIYELISNKNKNKKLWI